jgi:hypothetical protein
MVLDDFEDIYILAAGEEDENDDEYEEDADEGPEEAASPETA